MKARMVVVMVSVVLLALPGMLYAQESDPETVARSAYEALNAGDVEAALALYADDVVLSLGAFGSFSGKDELRGDPFQNDVANHAAWELGDFQAEGDTVTFTNRYTNDFLQSIGITLEGTEVITIRDGKIATDTWTATDESVAELQAAMPPEAMPVSGGAAVPLYALVAAFGGLMWFGGLGLGALRRHRRQVG